MVVLEVLELVAVLLELAYLPSSVVVAPSPLRVLQILLERGSSQQLLQVRVLGIAGPELPIPAVPLASRHWLRYHLDYPDSGYVLKAEASQNLPWYEQTPDDNFNFGPHGSSSSQKPLSQMATCQKTQLA